MNAARIRVIAALMAVVALAAVGDALITSIRAGARARSLVEQAVQLETAGRADSALRLFQSAIELEPEHPTAWIHVAQLSWQHGAQLGLGGDFVQRALARAAALDSVRPEADELKRRSYPAALRTDAELLIAASHGGAESLRVVAAPRLRGADSAAALRTQTLLAAIEVGGTDGSSRELAALFRRAEPVAIELAVLRAALGDRGRAAERRALASRYAAAAPAAEPEPHASRRILLTGLLLAGTGQERDERNARRLAMMLRDRARQTGDVHQSVHAKVLAGETELRDGHPRMALRTLGPPAVIDPVRDVLDWPLAHARWIRARAHAELGARDKALLWLDGFPEPQGSDLPYVERAASLRDSLRVRAAR